MASGSSDLDSFTDAPMFFQKVQGVCDGAPRLSASSPMSLSATRNTQPTEERIQSFRHNVIGQRPVGETTGPSCFRISKPMMSLTKHPMPEGKLASGEPKANGKKG